MLLVTVPEAVSSHTKARSRSAVQSINFEQNLCVAPRCPIGSLVPYNSKEQISFNSFYAPHCPRGSLVPYKSEENLSAGWYNKPSGTKDLPDQISPCLIRDTRYHVARYQIPDTWVCPVVCGWLTRYHLACTCCWRHWERHRLV